MAMTDQQILEAVADIVQQSEQRLERRLEQRLEARFAGMATKEDLHQFGKQLEDRLSAKIASSQTTNIRHHLETRQAIGDLNRQFTALREGLAHATGLA